MGIAEGHIVLLFSETETGRWLEQSVFIPAGYQTTLTGNRASVEKMLTDGAADLVLVGGTPAGSNLYLYAQSILQQQPQIPLILVTNQITAHEVLEALRSGFEDVLQLPATAENVLAVVENALAKRKRLADWARLEAQRDRLETILAQITDGVIVLDPENRVLLLNRSARDAFHVDGDLVSGRLVQDVIHHHDLLEILSEEKPEAPHRAEIRLEDSRVMNLRITPIAEIGTAITMQDITYLKELDRIKTDFVNTVSHDLRSPLTAILGYVELIERTGPTSGQQREFIQRVQLSVNSITALINDLLDLGRIEAGFDLRKEVVHLGLIVLSAVEGLRIAAAEKEQNLVMDFQIAPVFVLGNPVHLSQMAGNLINNAIKYTQAGGSIKVCLREEGGQAILNVVDNGPGIPTRDQPHIFDKFYRGSNVPADMIGSGLGLAIVQSIVDNHQGRIWVESALNKGSTFTVVLPASDQTL